MPRPNRTEERRREVLPTLAAAFAELGYRRATTAELAARCGLRENVLYRLYPDKKAMFLACLDDVAASSVQAWEELLQTPGRGSAAERLLAYESEHHGETGLYRLIFAGLSETDNPDIRHALRRMYETLHGFLRGLIEDHRAQPDQRADAPSLDATLAAWGAVGLGTLNNLMREFDLLPEQARRRLLRDAGRLLMDGSIDSRGSAATEDKP